MDLAALGKIAGIGGIAIGMIVVLGRLLIQRSSSLPAKERAPMLRLLAIGAFAIGGLGIVAWTLGNSAGVHVTGATGGITAGGNATGNTVNYGGPAGGPAASPAKP